MVLCAITKGGGGAEVRLATNGLQFDNGAGLAAFMDDLIVSARSVAGLKVLLRLLDGVLTTVDLALAESKTFHMGLQWMETAGRMSYHLRMSEAWGPAHLDGTSEHLVQHGSTTIRRVEVDEGLKELGVWLDGLGDWGEQMQKIRDSLSETLQELGRIRIPLELVLYL